MNVTFSCPRCEQAGRAEIAPDSQELVCPHCDVQMTLPADSFADGQLRRCVVCPSTELFVRKDFPQRLGVTIVVLGLAASCVTWYWSWDWTMRYATFGILFATAFIDAMLYLVCGDALNCYRCGAIYRHVDGLDNHPAFNLETHERHRQQAAREKKEVSR